jgi:hypothetical protein
MTDEERAIAMLGIGLNSRLLGLADGNPEASSKLNLKLIDPNVVQQNFREAVAERRDVPIPPPVQDRQGVAEGDLSRPISDDMLIKPISLPTMSSISTMESSVFGTDVAPHTGACIETVMTEDVKSMGKSLERIAIALEFLVKHFTSSFDKE